MCNINKKHTALLAIFMALTISVCAQTYTDTIKPFSGRNQFRTWSIGINVGALYSMVAIGGSNNFSTNPVDLGFGVNLKYQVTHWSALQLDIISGVLKGNQDNKLNDPSLLSSQQPTAFPAYRSVQSFETFLHYAASLSGVFTLGNINWLSVKNKVIPYVSLGGGIANYTPWIVTRVPPAPYTQTSQSHPYLIDKKSVNHFFVPVGFGLKFNLTRSLNLDLGYRMHFVDADNLDGYSYMDTRYGPANAGEQAHKDKFSYAFLGVEFSLGNKAKPQ